MLFLQQAVMPYYAAIVVNIINVQIHIIGLGVAEQTQLSVAAEQALQRSAVVIGSERQCSTLSLSGLNVIPLPKLSALKALLKTYEGMDVAILASGDPLYYGIGRWFTKNFRIEQLTFFPAISSVQAACHRQGLSLQDVSVISLHGRPLEKIRSQLKANKTLVILTDKNSQPQILAEECQAAGFSQSQITVLENLGYQQEGRQERKQSFSVDELLSQPGKLFDPLHVTIINVVGKGGVLPEFPGFPDSHFVTGEEPGRGMISKREVRLTILSYLQPTKDDVIWDIGAGCGGVAVELAYWNEHATIYAVECHQQRLHYLQQNRQRFGVVQNLHIVEGRAPEVLADLPVPNKVFIGGSNGELEKLLQGVWEALPEKGMLVASGVIENTKKQLQRFAKGLQPQQLESVELAVKRGHLDNGDLQFVPKLPVEIFMFKKMKQDEIAGNR